MELLLGGDDRRFCQKIDTYTAAAPVETNAPASPPSAM